MEAEAKRQEAWRQVEKKELTEGNMEVSVVRRRDKQGGHLTLKLTARVMTEDGVKYTCHCDWESRGRRGHGVRRSGVPAEDAVGRAVPVPGVAGVVQGAAGEVPAQDQRDGAVLGHGADDDEGGGGGASDEDQRVRA